MIFVILIDYKYYVSCVLNTLLYVCQLFFQLFALLKSANMIIFNHTYIFFIQQYRS